jgi:hypothetical protein
VPLKRSELVEFLKEVLRVCGESIAMEMVWLNKTESVASSEDENYQLFIKLSSGTLDQECLNRAIEKFGLKMRKEGELWIFSRNE